jgi:hypothetical protein
MQTNVVLTLVKFYNLILFYRNEQQNALTV